MRIIVLNTWNGKLKSEIVEYISNEIERTDIFCFQEYHGNMSAIGLQLFRDKFNIFTIGKTIGSNFTQSICVKKEYKVISNQNIFGVDYNIGLGQYLGIELPGENLHIVNVHGVTGKNDLKHDNENRLIQSKGFIDFINNKKGKKIICGDFNILRDQKSITMFKDFEYQDLISDFNIYTTRNKFSWETYENKQLDSDYVFLDKDTEIKSFQVEDNLISDHLPMVLEI